jgi:hypothetical protein
MTETTDQAPPAIKAKSPWWHTVLALAIAIIVVKLGGMIAAIAAFAAFYFIRPRFGTAAAVLGGLASAAVVGVAVVVGASMFFPHLTQAVPAGSFQPNPITARQDNSPPTKLVPFNGKLDGE